MAIDHSLTREGRGGILITFQIIGHQHGCWHSVGFRLGPWPHSRYGGRKE